MQPSYIAIKKLGLYLTKQLRTRKVNVNLTCERIG